MSYYHALFLTLILDFVLAVIEYWHSLNKIGYNYKADIIKPFLERVRGRGQIRKRIYLVNI